MPIKVRATAPAKINLTFDITGTRSDGYHEVQTLLQSIDLEDQLTLHLEPSKTEEIAISCLRGPGPNQFPTDESNLIHKAARLFFQKVRPFSDGEFKLHVEVEKNIPIGAGLAGGSADAAATLVGLNKIFDDRLSTQELLELGGALGADVPFCVRGGTAIGTSRGDVLEQLPETLGLTFCIVKPIKASVSTPWAYREFDNYKGALRKPDIKSASKAMIDGNLEAAIAEFCNVFEPMIFEHISELPKLKHDLLELGAWACHLSGSGPALFAVVADREQAHYIRRKILKNEDDGFEYGSGQPLYEFGPPLEFHIAQSIPHGAQATIVERSEKSYADKN